MKKNKLYCLTIYCPDDKVKKVENVSKVSCKDGKVKFCDPETKAWVVLVCIPVCIEEQILDVPDDDVDVEIDVG